MTETRKKTEEEGGMGERKEDRRDRCNKVRMKRGRDGRLAVQEERGSIVVQEERGSKIRMKRGRMVNWKYKEEGRGKREQKEKDTRERIREGKRGKTTARARTRA